MKTGPVPSTDASAAEHRAEQRAGNGDGEHRPDQLTAPVRRRDCDQPGQRCGPRERTADALEEAREVERDDRVRVAEDRQTCRR